MNLIKKVFCLLLSVFVLTGAMIVSFAEDSAGETLSDAHTQKALDRMNVLQIIGIIPESSDYIVELNKEVTRASFADAIAKLICAENYSGATPYFYDVPTSHWAYKSINSLAERGIVNGTAARLFRPDDSIATVDAMKILLNVMGYDDYVQYNGGYPTGYLLAAKRTGISDGVSTTGTLTNAVMYQILYQAMNTEILEGITYGTDGNIKYTVSDKTLLSMYHDIYRVRGALNGANSVSLTGASLGENESQIDDVLYEDETEAFQYLGEKVEALYRWDGTSDIKTIIWLTSYGKSDVLNIEVNHDASFDLNSFRLNYIKDNGSKGYINFSRSGTLVYNGGIVTDGYDDYFNRSVYRVKMIARNGGEYDVAIMQECKNVVVASIDTVRYKIYDKRDAAYSLDVDEGKYDSLKIRRDVGAAISLSNIKAGDVLSVFESADSKNMEIVVSSDKVSGKLETISERENEYELTVNGETYLYSKTEGSLDCSPGVFVTLQLDAFKRVAYIEVTGTNSNAAYLIKGGMKNSAFNDIIQFKVLHSDGEVKVLECTEQIKLDGVKYKDSSKAYEKFLDDDGNFQSQLVLLTQNADGIITGIDTAEMGPGEGTDTLQISVPRITGDWRRTNIDGYMANDNSTVVFTIPPMGTVDAPDDDYRVTGINDTILVNAVAATSYKTKEKVGHEQFVVLEWSPRTDVIPEPFIVKDMAMKLGADGEMHECISAYQGKGLIECTAAEGFSFSALGIGPGSVIRISKDRKNDVAGAQVVFNLSDLDKRTKSYNPLAWEVGTQRGEAVDVTDGVLSMNAREDNALPDGWTDAGNFRIDCTNATVWIWDTQASRNNLQRGTVNNISQGDYVIMDTEHHNPRTLFVYK